MISFFVRGKPVPKGSFIARKVGKFAYAVDTHKNQLDYWQKLISDSAEYMLQIAGYGTLPAFFGAVGIALEFHRIRPKTVRRLHPITEPDIDKLARAVLDGLTGVVYKDDAQVIEANLSKIYSHDEGVSITIQALEEMALDGAVNAADSISR